MNLETVLHANIEEPKREKNHVVRVILFSGQKGRIEG